MRPCPGHVLESLHGLGRCEGDEGSEALRVTSSRSRHGCSPSSEGFSLLLTCPESQGTGRAPKIRSEHKLQAEGARGTSQQHPMGIQDEKKNESRNAERRQVPMQ